MDYKNEISDIDRSIHRLHMKYSFLQFKEMDIHPGQIAMLSTLYDNQGCTQSDMAKEHGVSCATVGVSVKRLEKAGLLKKSTDEYDMRTTRLELTDKGEKYAVMAKAVVDKINDVKMRGFSKQELIQYYGFLKRIKLNLETTIEEGKDN
ncbi:MAG: MarR family winged helix-turn-helix transcriptional regulator [Oscillospiraceae bacterium]